MLINGNVLWGHVVEVIRTIFYKHNGHIYIPDLSA